MTDLLSSLLAAEWAETWINKIYKLMDVILAFALAWVVICLLDLYKYIQNTPSKSKFAHMFYYYKVVPVIGIAELAMNITWIVLLRQAWGNWKKYIETSDDHLMQKGLKEFYSATLLVAVWFIFSIANTAYRTFFL